MSTQAQLAEAMGAARYPEIADSVELREYYAAPMAAFMAVAIVDLSGIEGDCPFGRLQQAVAALASADGSFADRFRAALRSVTIAQLGEQRAHQWFDLKLSRKAHHLYLHYRKDLIARHPELVAVGAGL